MPKIPFHIKFEGPATVGKSTCQAKVAKFLKEEGYDVRSLGSCEHTLVVIAPEVRK